MTVQEHEAPEHGLQIFHGPLNQNLGKGQTLGAITGIGRPAPQLNARDWLQRTAFDLPIGPVAELQAAQPPIYA